MARKKTDIRNISYDQERETYYITLNYGYNEKGVQIKKTKTAKRKTEAKKILKPELFMRIEKEQFAIQRTY